ncbi:hypothetical protein HHI36_018101 [Cryptolaemus montrouzieri]|uniref:RING-type domain-containing protein n=1 Tax=Cryptolaemus montrouzieri TaxID=559131 RepID=A0ABD2NYZ0_9CUCU
MSSSKFKFKELLNNSIRECAICFEPMEYIAVCTNGHSFCLDCKSSLRGRACPFCNVELDKRRNLNMERLFSKARWGILRNIKDDSTICCPSCSKLMEANILLCPSGHSLCEACAKNKECVLCFRPVVEGRNYLLEQLIVKIKDNFATPVVSIVKNTDKITCPFLKCSYRGCKFPEHIIANHFKKSSPPNYTLQSK